jgi:hypothetical protein
MAPLPKPAPPPTQFASAPSITLPPPAPFPAAVLGPILAPAITAVTAQTQSPTPLVAHHILTLAAMAAQRLISVRLPTGAQRPVSCFFASLVGAGEGRGAAERLIAEAARAAQPTPRIPSLNLFYDPRPPRVRDGEDRYRAFVRQAGVFTRHPHDLIAPGAHRRAEAVTLCALWDGKVIKSALTGTSYPRLSAHLVTTARAARAVLGDADLLEAGFLGRLLVAAPASNIGAREFAPAENDDPPPAFGRLLSYLGELYEKPPTAPTRIIGFSKDAAAVWLSYARETEDAMRAGGALAPVRAFAVHLPEHAARLAAIVALMNDGALAEITAAQLETGLGLARFYTDERVRLAGAAAPDLSEAEKEDLLREWLQRNHEGKVITLRDLCRTGPKEVRAVDAAYKLMRRLERLGIVHPSNETLPGASAPRRQRVSYAWHVESEAAMRGTQHVA